MVLVQGLDVAALAVNVLLIYFSKTARQITKESESGGRMGGESAILLASYSILHYFHFASKIIPQMLGDFQKAPQQAHGDPAPLSAKGLIRGRELVSYQFIDPLV